MGRRDFAIGLLASALLATADLLPAEEVGAPGGSMEPRRGESPSPREVIPVPVIPDKMAVPAPTVQDKIKKPGEPPAVQPGDHETIPEPEQKPVTPPIPGRNK
jgi:hypothetical protein